MQSSVSKLRIAVVTSYFPMKQQPYRGQSAYQTLLYLKDYAAVRVYVPAAVYPRFLTPRTFQYFRPEPSYGPRDLWAQYIEYPALPLISRPLNGWTCRRSVMPLLESWAPDLILNYNLYPEGYAAVRAGKRMNVPVVVCAIGSDVRRISDPATRALTRYVLREASFVITVSDELRTQALAMGASRDRTRAVPNGCDPSIFHPASRSEARKELCLEPEAPLVLYVGRLDTNKGLLELIEAFAGLRTRIPGALLTLLGEGVLEPALRARARQEGMEAQVRFVRPCDSSGVSRWMAAANVFCLPSHSEGCPNTVIEALACGRPVVASAVGGIPELVGSECGVIVPPGNALKLEAGLGQALSRTWDEAAISSHCTREWRAVAEDTFNICCEAISSFRGAPLPVEYVGRY